MTSSIGATSRAGLQPDSRCSSWTQHAAMSAAAAIGQQQQAQRWRHALTAAAAALLPRPPLLRVCVCYCRWRVSDLRGSDAWIALFGDAHKDHYAEVGRMHCTGAWLQCCSAAVLLCCCAAAAAFRSRCMCAGQPCQRTAHVRLRARARGGRCCNRRRLCCFWQVEGSVLAFYSPRLPNKGPGGASSSSCGGLAASQASQVELLATCAGWGFCKGKTKARAAAPCAGGCILAACSCLGTRRCC